VNALYRFAQGLLRFWSILVGLKIEGKEHIPINEPFVIVANHTSYCDPVIMGVSVPFPVTFMAKEEFSHNQFLKKLFTSLGVVFIKRNEADILALKLAVNLVKEGRSIGIFPEGRRNLSGTLMDFKQGGIFIAYKANVKILPMGIKNSSHLVQFWHRDVSVRIGTPINLIKQDGKNTQEFMDEYTKLLKQEIETLIS